MYGKIKPIISFKQHGFTKKRKTATNLVEFTSCVVNVIESGKQLDVIYTDFSKAFDRVSHSVLISKLTELGIFSHAVNWIESYLRGRSQVVKIGSSRSKIIQVVSGVPQGSHLGPLLFILFVNDIPDIFKTANCLMYADDVKIFHPVSSITDANELQSDLDAFTLWCRNNRLALNVSKCKQMSYTRRIKNTITFSYCINQTPLTRVSQIRDLGVLFDSDICFNNHVNAIVTKACSMLGFLFRLCSEFRNPNSLKALYCAHVRSHLEYCSVVWFPYYDTYSHKIESVQKKFLKFLFYRFGWYRLVKYAPYNFKCKLVHLESLEDRRRNSSVFFFHDILSGHIDAPNLLSKINFNVPSHVLRNFSLFKIQSHRTNYGSMEPLNRMAALVNEFISTLDLDITDGKNRLRQVMKARRI